MSAKGSSERCFTFVIVATPIVESVVPVIALYVLSTCFTGTVSSHTFVRLFGALSLLSFIATYFFAASALVSVWCFFAAVLSLLIYLHLRYREFGGFPTPDSISDHHGTLEAVAKS